MLGKVQLGLIHNPKRELIIEELRLRRINIDPKNQITKMKQLLIVDEHPDTETNTKTKIFPNFFWFGIVEQMCFR